MRVDCHLLQTEKWWLNGIFDSVQLCWVTESFVFEDCKLLTSAVSDVCWGSGAGLISNSLRSDLVSWMLEIEKLVFRMVAAAILTRNAFLHWDSSFASLIEFSLGRFDESQSNLEELQYPSRECHASEAGRVGRSRRMEVKVVTEIVVFVAAVATDRWQPSNSSVNLKCRDCIGWLCLA